jgi:ubiquinone/menaquinone biosynthesis C-methylase UbiE
MLARARERGLRVVQGSITELPFPPARFDVVYSFKVLAHVERIHEALSEMSRVLRPGGYLLAEFYNPLSLRGLIKRLKPPTAISERSTDEAVYTRYDGLTKVRSYLPADCHIVTLRGVRVVTPAAALHALPGVGRLLAGLERKLADAPLFRRLGGFLIVVAQKA